MYKNCVIGIKERFLRGYKSVASFYGKRDTLVLNVALSWNCVLRTIGLQIVLYTELFIFTELIHEGRSVPVSKQQRLQQNWRIQYNCEDRRVEITIEGIKSHGNRFSEAAREEEPSENSDRFKRDDANAFNREVDSPEYDDHFKLLEGVQIS
ncbi:hypothetical protein ABEB36_001967 [Hypothenemus hampei]|uniref:Uncharacterized protein n=1 Tax=Hypothenemus hampei TaxID=57062 RepID=A0ABD1FJU4_HYPHA